MQQATSATAIAKQRALDALTDNLQATLGEINNHVSTLTEFRHRLMNPRPADASAKQPEAPAPQTVEGRLHDLVRFANSISARLQDVLGDLNGAA